MGSDDKEGITDAAHFAGLPAVLRGTGSMAHLADGPATRRGGEQDLGFLGPLLKRLQSAPTHGQIRPVEAKIRAVVEHQHRGREGPAWKVFREAAYP